MIHVIAAAVAHNKFSKDAEDDSIEYIIGCSILVLIVIALAIISYFWNDTCSNALYNFIEWTCSFNGTFDIKAFFGIK